MTDRYAGASDDLDGPGASFRAVTPSDTVPLPYASKALYIGGTGSVSIIGVEDTAAVTFAGVPAGTVLRVRAKQVMQTNTSATSIIAYI
jgi:hypothetical protein